LNHRLSITAWGGSKEGGKGAPLGNNYTKIYSTKFAFAALKADGSITAWGDSDEGGTGAPSDNGYNTQLNKSWYSHYQRVRLCLHHSNHPTLRLNHRL
jgi:hypothetical protein